MSKNIERLNAPLSSLEPVALLTHLLEQAQRGEITAFAAACLCVDGGSLVAVSDPGADALRLIGAVSYMNHQMNVTHHIGWDSVERP